MKKILINMFVMSALFAVNAQSAVDSKIRLEGVVTIADDPTTSFPEGNLFVEGTTSLKYVEAAQMVADYLNLQGYRWSGADQNSFSGQGLSLGFKNKISPWSIVVGQGNKFASYPTSANGQMTIVVGSGNISDAATNSIAVGCDNLITLNSSIALGIGNAVGPHMAGIGADLVSNSKFQVTVGSANDPSIRVSGRDDIWNPEDPIFVVGNGETKQARSNALVVRKSGDAEILGSLEIQESVTAKSVKVGKASGGISMGEFGPQSEN